VTTRHNHSLVYVDIFETPPEIKIQATPTPERLTLDQGLLVRYAAAIAEAGIKLVEAVNEDGGCSPKIKGRSEALEAIILACAKEGRDASK
jgi:hypothetical protein